MHATAETSRKSYVDLVEGNCLPPSQRKVVAALYLHGPLTRDQIAEKTGMRLASACGRVHELIKSGVVEGWLIVKCKETGKAQQQLRLAPKQLSLI